MKEDIFRYDGVDIKFNNEELRRCPFCDNTVKLKFIMVDGYGNHDHRPDTPCATIGCDCEVKPHISAILYDIHDHGKTKKSIEKIINLWNGNKRDIEPKIYTAWKTL